MEEENKSAKENIDEVKPNDNQTEQEKKDESKQEEVVNKNQVEQENVTENEQKPTKKIEKTERAEEIEKTPQKNKKKIGIIIASVAIIILIMLFSIIFALLNINNSKILKGISILGIDVGNLTVDEAKQRVNDAIEEKFSSENDNITLKHGELEISIDANTLNASFDVDDAVAKAYNTGRSGNIVTNNYAILWTKLFKKQIKPKLNIDEELTNKTIADINAKMTDAVIEYSYYIDGENLVITKGKAGKSIKQEQLKKEIIKQLNNIHSPYQEIEIPVENKEPDPINLEKIKNEIYKEPQDAYIEKNPTVVHVEVDGVDFGISMEEAKKIIQEDKEKYEIPLKITKAQKKLSDLGEDAFPDQLATFSTIYDASNRNRAHNIELASRKMDGTIVMPGETFSYNKVTGLKTIANGYKEGTAYVGGKVVPDIGGGVCQLSSTLYNTALLANLEITQRSNHMFLTGYVAAGRDATVYDGSLDFCFKNTRKYPIKIVSKSGNGVCKVTIYGIKEEVEYDVIIQSKVNSYINYKVTYKEDPNLEEGKEKVEQAGHNGCRSEAYKILKLNGKIISQTLLSKDIYNAQERIVIKGTKKVNTTIATPSTPTTSTGGNANTDGNTGGSTQTNGGVTSEDTTPGGTTSGGEITTPVNGGDTTPGTTGDSTSSEV